MPNLKTFIGRFLAAYAKLSAADQLQVKSFMRQSYDAMHSHLEIATGRASGPALSDDFGAEGVALAYALVFEDPHQVSTLVEIVERHRQLGTLPSITPGGEIMSIEKYEQLDPFWIECVVIWLLYYLDPVEFPEATHSSPGTTNIVQIPDQTCLAIAGDWGTGPIPGKGPTPSLAMMNFIRQHLKPEYTIHLGDTYYAGTSEEEHDNFLPGWAAGSKGSFSLNSNHEMMAGGHGYFGTLLADPRFSAQNGFSYFALENSHWLIVGLDSAYYADRDKMFSNGALDSEIQIPFLTAMAEKAASENKKVIVLTHHNGFGYSGGKPKKLWKQVFSAFPGETGPDYWYWGHAHVGAVYPPRAGTAARCCGHGGIPWAYSSGLEKAKQDGDVDWFESIANLDRPPQVNNGFAVLELDEEKPLKEAFYDHTGSKSWSSP